MALSFVLYDGTGGTDTFTVPFDYLKRADVSVELDGVDVTDDITWLSDTSIQLTTTSGTDNVEIRRTTDPEDPEVTFEDGSTPTADELNRAAKQALFLHQERIDAGDDVTVTEGSILFGTYAALPAAGTANRLYCTTDTNQLYRDTGSVWQLLEGAITGAVTKSAGGTVTSLGTIPNDSFTYAKLQNVSATDKILPLALVTSKRSPVRPLGAPSWTIPVWLRSGRLWVSLRTPVSSAMSIAMVLIRLSLTPPGLGLITPLRPLILDQRSI
jgi:hypothetical protein